MNNCDSVVRDVTAQNLARLYQKYTTSSRYEILDAADPEAGFTAKETNGAYIARIVKGIACTVFSLGIAYYRCQSIRDLFAERKLKQFARETSQPLPQSITTEKPQDSVVIIFDDITLEEPLEDLKETYSFEESPLQEFTTHTSLSEDTIDDHIPESESENEDIEDEESNSSSAAAEISKAPTPTPTNFSDEEELPLPPTRRIELPPTDAPIDMRDEEPPFAPPLRTPEAPPSAIAAAAERNERIANLCEELQERAIYNLTALRFTLEVLKRQRNHTSKSVATKAGDMVMKLEKLITQAQALRDAFLSAENGDDIIRIYLSDDFKLYGLATNAFLCHYNAAEALCRQDPIYSATGNPSDAIQSTYQLLTRHRLFADEFHRLCVPRAGEALERVSTIVLAMNAAIEESSKHKDIKALFAQVENFFDNLFD
jgi:hypothetical protein